MTTNNENTNNTNNTKQTKANPIDVNFKLDDGGNMVGLSVDAAQITPLLKEHMPKPQSVGSRIAEKAAILLVGGLTVVGVGAGLSYILSPSDAIPSAAAGASADPFC